MAGGTQAVSSRGAKASSGAQARVTEEGKGVGTERWGPLPQGPGELPSLLAAFPGPLPAGQSLSLVAPEDLAFL